MMAPVNTTLSIYVIIAEGPGKPDFGVCSANVVIYNIYNNLITYLESLGAVVAEFIPDEEKGVCFIYIVMISY